MNTLKRDQQILLFILTGDSRPLPDHLKPIRKKRKVWEPAGLAPENYTPRKKFKRSNPANPNMNEQRAWEREIMFESRSHHIEDEASRAKFIHVYSNQQSTFTGAHRQSPCHRDMTNDERTGKRSPKVGPQIRK